MTTISGLSDLMLELRAELQVQHQPERRARATLKPNRHGWTEEPYADEAFRIWEDTLGRFPQDLQTVHHLAIMHHARAFDLEQSEDSTRADADWKRALELWYRLWSEDGFWEELARRVDPDLQNPFPEVRLKLPEQLLQVHFDIAFDQQTANHRARQHVKIALDSPFPHEAKDRVRLRAYERLTGGLPPAVWNAGTIDRQTLDPALQAVAGYLSLDEMFQPALADLLSLLVKVQLGYVQRINAAGAVDTPEDRQRELEDLKTADSLYDPYVERLERHIAELEPEVLSNLTQWHRLSGQAHRALDEYELAAAHYRRALASAARDDTNTLTGDELRNEWALSVILAAREDAGRGETGKARELIASTRREEGLSAECLVLRAGIWVLLREFDEARQDCNRAVQLDPDNSAIFILRAQYHLALLDVDRARADLERAERLAASGGSEQRDALRELRKHVDSLQQRIDLYGGVRSFQLQQQATEAFNNGQFGRAGDLLRQALRVASTDGRAELEKELRICLAKQADSPLQQAIRRLEAGDFGGARRFCDQALQIYPECYPALLYRAQCHLDAQNVDAACADLDLAEVHAKRDGDRKALEAAATLRRTIQQIEQRTAEFGGAAAFHLRQQAVEAFNGGQVEQAISLLRQAISVARRGHEQKLREELAICLDALAVRKTNEAIKLMGLDK